MDVTERLLNTKIMLFLEFLRFAVGFLRSDYLGGLDSFEKVQRNRIIRLKKCLYAINGTLLFGGDHYILSGIIPLFISILYPKWYKSINLAELHNVEHLIQYSVNSGMPTLVKMTIIPMAHRVVVGFEMVKKHIHYFSFKLYILKK